MLHEDLRYVHEDVERLEQAIADRVLEEPKHVSRAYHPMQAQKQSSPLTDP